MMTRRPINRKYNRKRLRLGNLLSLGTMCIVLIIAFGLLGVGYAAWNQPFNIFGTIQTGNINVTVTDVVFEGTGKSADIGPIHLVKELSGERVDEVDMRIITGVQPLTGRLVFTVKNTGTIPIICEGIDLEPKGTLQLGDIQTNEKIGVNETGTISVEITKEGYIDGLEFNTSLKFVQATD